MLKLVVKNTKFQNKTKAPSYKLLKKIMPSLGNSYTNKIFAITGYSLVVDTLTLITLPNFKKLKSVISFSQNLLLTEQRLFADRAFFLITNKFYRGIRYLKKLPVRGQRTHTNAKTARFLNHRSI